eukprot:1130987-Prymnesium_polylepis.1
MATPTHLGLGASDNRRVIVSRGRVAGRRQVRRGNECRLQELDDQRCRDATGRLAPGRLEHVGEKRFEQGLALSPNAARVLEHPLGCREGAEAETFVLQRAVERPEGAVAQPALAQLASSLGHLNE